MPVRTACSSCGKKLQVRDELLGKRVKCPGCGTAFLATAVDTSEAVKAGAPRPGPEKAKDKVSAKPMAKTSARHRDDDEDDEDSEDRPARGKKSKQQASPQAMWIGIAAAVVLLLGGVAAYFLFFSGPAKTQAQIAGPAPKKKEGLPSGSVPLAELVPADTWFFMSTSPELAKAPAYQALKQKPGVSAALQSFDLDSPKELGVPEADIERGAMFSVASVADIKNDPTNKSLFMMVVQTNKPFDQKAVAKAVKNGKVGREFKMAAEFITDQTLLLGTPSALKKYKSRDKDPATGVLAEALNKASTSQGIVASVVLPPEAIAEFIRGYSETFSAVSGLPVPPHVQAWFDAFRKVQAALVTLEMTDQLALSVTLVTDNAAAARGIKKAADELIGQARSFFDQWAKVPDMASLVITGRSTLKELILSVKDKDVTLDFHTDPNKLLDFAMGAVEKITNPSPVVAEANTPKKPDSPTPEAPKKDPVTNQPGNQIPSQGFQGQNFQGMKIGGKKGQKGLNPNLLNPNALNPKGPFPTPVPLVPGEVEKIALKLIQHIGAVIDPEAQTALLLTPMGHARLYAYPNFTAQGTFKLTGGPAYRSVHDEAKERLFALSPNVKGKDPTSQAGGSQALIYPIRDLLDGKLKKNQELTPTKIIQLGGFCTHLCLSPDEETLYALDTSNPKALKVLRVNVSKGAVDASGPVPDFTVNLVLSRDGKSLYALSYLTPHTKKQPSPGGAIVIIDPETMKATGTISIPVDPFAMEVTKDGIAYVSGFGGLSNSIIVLNARKKSLPLAIWQGIQPNSCLKLSEDEKFLYVSNWKGTPAIVGALALPRTDMLLGSQLPTVQWAKSPYVECRGEMVITPDNQFILCDSGVLFNLKIAEQAGAKRVPLLFALGSSVLSTATSK